MLTMASLTKVRFVTHRGGAKPNTDIHLVEITQSLTQMETAWETGLVYIARLWWAWRVLSCGIFMETYGSSGGHRMSIQNFRDTAR